MLGIRRSSILLKLFLILAIAGTIINLVVFGGIRYIIFPHPRLRENIQRNVSQYVNYLINDLGPDPSYAKAKELTDRLGVGIRFIGTQASWASPPGLPRLDELVSSRGGAIKDEGAGRIGHRGYFAVRRTLPSGDAIFIVFAPKGPHFESRIENLIALILAVSLIVAIAFVSIRWVLRPLDSLNEAVIEIGRGQLDSPIPFSGSDELANLARSLNQMRSRLREMIRSKEQLLIDVSHELRSPLTRMKVATEFVANPETKRQLGEEVDEMERMITEILESARMDSAYGGLALESVDLGDLVDEIANKYQDRMPRIHIAACSKGIVTRVDRERMKLAIRNLIENALKYSPPDSTIEVRLKREAERAVIEIQDHGGGIPPEEIEHVFQPFYRVDKSRSRATGGFGLGLSFCRKIVRAHGGEVVLSSEVGKGTTAIVTLPIQS